MSSSTNRTVLQSPKTLVRLKSGEPHDFIIPAKRITEGHDVPAFLTSQAYRDICIFIMQLNIAMCPRKLPDSNNFNTWPLDIPITLGQPVRKLQELLQKIASIIDEAPPDTGPRRFGNVSFRKWYEILESRIEELLKEHLPQNVLGFSSKTGSPAVLAEITPYLLGGFGSPQRLDYGTGHELSFMAFLGCLWKLGAFSEQESIDCSLEREIIIGVVEPYLQVVRRLILTYTLEPAGSHGVWGLDDHSFVSYIFGSSQFCPAISDDDPMPEHGAILGAPKPGDVAKKTVVDEQRQNNMYFSAIGFINDVKTGPFWEHSPQLYDISGVRDGWGKINKGMIKMYHGEVLSKFPVVQHFPFGSLFSWDQDPNAISLPTLIHSSSQPPRSDTTTTQASAIETTKAPWANMPAPVASIPTQAPWANQSNRSLPAEPPTRSSWATQSNQLPRAESVTRVPSAFQPRDPVGRTNVPSQGKEAPTMAPWAKRSEDRDVKDK